MIHCNYYYQKPSPYSGWMLYDIPCSEAKSGYSNVGLTLKAESEKNYHICFYFTLLIPVLLNLRDGPGI